MRTTFLSAWNAHAIAAVIAIAMILSTAIPSAGAQKVTHYNDVPEGSYYEDAAAALLLSGALDSDETLFRPSSLATRAEVMKLLVNVYGSTLLYPATPSFDDVPRTAWYYPYIETAAKEGWLRGDKNCYGTTQSTCMARPASNVNRAEMAIILERAFRLSNLGLAPIFRDNTDTRQWYHMPVQTAADHCVLQGDEIGGFVRPAAFMNRAEMIVMAYRAQQEQRYGQDCAAPNGQILGVTTPSSRMVRVTFNSDMDPNRIDEVARYAVEELNGTSINISEATIINARTVEFTLARALTSGTSYRLRVDNMRTETGTIFSDTRTFVSSQGDDEMPAIENAVTLSANTLRLTFTEDLDEGRAEDEARYSVTRLNAVGTVTIRTATLVGARTVDIELNSNVVAQSSYRISVSNLMTDAGTVFSDSATFTHGTPTPMGHILSAESTSSTKVRVTFDTDLDEFRAEQTSRYAIANTGSSVTVSSANLLNDERTVELTLSQSLAAQSSYTLHVTDLLTQDANLFSDSETFVFSNTSEVSFTASLRGNQQVPTVSTPASGTGTFTLTSNGLQYSIVISSLTGSFTMAHFHLGDTGVNGPVVSNISFSGNTANGTWTNITAAQRNSLLAGDIYVNIHTNKFPDGEIRGQVNAQ